MRAGECKAEGADVAKLPADSPQRSGRQSQLSRRLADLQVRLQGLRDQFSQRQSKVYSKFFQKIHDVVDAYAKAHKLIVVINFSSDVDNPTKPTDVAREVGQPVVWHTEGIDITPAIAKLLEQARAEEAKKAGSPPAAVRETRRASETCAAGVVRTCVPAPSAPRTAPFAPAAPPKTAPPRGARRPPRPRPRKPPPLRPRKGAAKHARGLVRR